MIAGAALVGGIIGAATQIASNLLYGSEHWYDGVAGAFVGGAVYNVVSLTTSNPILAGYAAAAVEAVVDEGMEYLLGKKALSREHLVESAGQVAISTIWNGSFYSVAGKAADSLLPIPSNYGFNLFEGPVAKRIAQQTIRQAEVYLISKITIRSLLS